MADPNLICFGREINELKLELAMRDSFSQRAHVDYRPYNEEQRICLQTTVLDYLESSNQDALAPLEILSLRHMKEILRTCKVIPENKWCKYSCI